MLGFRSGFMVPAPTAQERNRCVVNNDERPCTVARIRTPMA
jgi:hypothetical protein